jgi:hypothetical protein
MRKPVLILLIIVFVVLMVTQLAAADPTPCDERVNDTHDKLLECVTLEGVRAHQAAFQAIADANGGTRAAGTSGYDASVAYVAETLESAGYEVELDPFDFTLVSSNRTTRMDLIAGEASALPDGSPGSPTIPVVAANFPQDIALSQDGSEGFINVDSPQEVTQYNLIAELPGRFDDNVVMAGAHLDSVQAGPGIQDNGSGSAAILETAVQMARVKPRNTVRFAWWGAEELGLVGSTAYVNGLTQDEQDNIALYLNFDMIGSPNHVFFIYDGDDSDGDGAGPGPEGSAQIEALFESYYEGLGLPFKGVDIYGLSDFQPFVDVGIPSGGLFTGAGGVKTDGEAALWGGTAGDQYDPCYHLACDTFNNIKEEAYAVNSDAVAYSILQYAMPTESGNGVNDFHSWIPILTTDPLTREKTGSVTSWE